MRRATFICVCASALIGACGGGGTAPSTTPRASHPSVCLAAARTTVARASGASVSSQRQSTGNNAQPQCTYRAGQLTVVANVDSSPQPYDRLERTVVEAQQQFGAVRTEPPPERVPGLGLDADWFPREHQLLTTDGRKLITVTVSWRGAPKARKRALAGVVARVYLGRRAAPGG